MQGAFGPKSLDGARTQNALACARMVDDDCCLEGAKAVLQIHKTYWMKRQSLLCYTPTTPLCDTNNKVTTSTGDQHPSETTATDDVNVLARGCRYPRRRTTATINAAANIAHTRRYKGLQRSQCGQTRRNATTSPAEWRRHKPRCETPHAQTYFVSATFKGQSDKAAAWSSCPDALQVLCAHVFVKAMSTYCDCLQMLPLRVLRSAHVGQEWPSN